MPLWRGLLWWPFQRSLSRCRVMTMTLVGNHDGDPRFGGVYVALVGSQGGCVCPRDGRVP
jgi:hypothetical protein